MKAYGDVDSKFRFVIVASKRAKQLLKGDKPKIKLKTKNLIRIAQEEVKKGVIDFKILPPSPEEAEGPEEESFIGEEIGPEPGMEGGTEEKTDTEKESKAKDKKKESA